MKINNIFKETIFMNDNNLNYYKVNNLNYYKVKSYNHSSKYWHILVNSTNKIVLLNPTILDEHIDQ